MNIHLDITNTVISGHAFKNNCPDRVNNGTSKGKNTNKTGSLLNLDTTLNMLIKQTLALHLDMYLDTTTILLMQIA